MKMKNVIVGLILSVALLFSATSGIAQDREGTYIEEKGEIQDSLNNDNVLLFGEEYEKDNTTTIVIVVAVAVIAAGGLFIVLRRRKKNTA